MSFDLQARLKVTEIFHSVQGESTLIGERFSFVRLTGCPLRCTYCDTTYSYTGGQWQTVEQILETVRAHETRWVCLTGGEPLIQKHSIHLVKALAAIGKNISIETDGEEDVSQYIGIAKLIMDIKTPGSGETAEKCFQNLEHLKPSDEIKFVICSREDYEWSVGVCREYKLSERFTVLFSPSFGKVALKDLAEWIIADKVNVRLQTQLHKHIWGESVHGV
jgi:7-carboxy-7-deazaguanine synthase